MTDSLPKFPDLRSFEDADSYPFAVGASLSKLKSLHDFALKYSSSPSGNRGSRKALWNIAAEIRDHIEWLNTETKEREAAKNVRDASRQLETSLRS